MNQNLLKDFRNYCHTASTAALLLGLGILMLVIGMICLVNGGILVGVLILAGAVILLWSQISSSRRTKAYIQQLEESGRLDIVLQDFSRAQKYLDDNMRFGRQLYCKNCLPVTYDRIGKAYQQIKRRNFVETNRFLILLDTNGKQIASVTLKLKGKSDQELTMVMAKLKTLNPQIHLGYR